MLLDKKRIVLHICCAPDEAWALASVKEEFDATCFFCNPNIHPLDEYEKRRTEAERTAAMFDSPFFCDDYNPTIWHNAVKDLRHTAEAAERCWECYRIRLERTATFCVSYGYERFGTVLSVSPHKNILMVDEMGILAASTAGIEYVPFSFRKDDGFKKSVELSKQLGIYRQNYCGCELSLAERDIRFALRAKKTATEIRRGI